MNEFEISDYGIFSNSIGTTEALRNRVESIKTSVANLKTIINSESIFLGPIADNCKESLSDADINMEALSDNLSRINDFLVNISTNYSSGDSSAASAILELNYSNFKGKVGEVASSVKSAQ